MTNSEGTATISLDLYLELKKDSETLKYIKTVVEDIKIEIRAPDTNMFSVGEKPKAIEYLLISHTDAQNKLIKIIKGCSR